MMKSPGRCTTMIESTKTEWREYVIVGVRADSRQMLAGDYLFDIPVKLGMELDAGDKVLLRLETTATLEDVNGVYIGNLTNEA